MHGTTLNQLYRNERLAVTTIESCPNRSIKLVKEIATGRSVGFVITYYDKYALRSDGFVLSEYIKEEDHGTSP